MAASLGGAQMAQGRDWTEEETCRVLELYQRLPFGKFHQTNPDVVALAEVLERSPSAVAMKLSNLASLDPAITSSGRKGLDGATQLDKKIWAEFNSHPSENATLPSGRVWITSFWGFNPEQDGYLGFSREGDRTTFLREWRRGDLVMVYITMSENADPADQGRIAGFLEIEPRTIRDTERMSPAGIKWKVDHGLTERWRFAVPALRAWRTLDHPLARDIAPTTLAAGANFRLIASRGLFLQPEEAEFALSLKVRPVQAFGGTALDTEEIGKVYTPSKGFPMSFGRGFFEKRDGEHYLYALKFDCDVPALIGAPAHQLQGKVVVKVGLTKDPDQRCSQHNACLPPAGKMRWKVVLRSSSLPDGATTLAAEDALKQHFSQRFQSLGGEFFLCDERTLASEFARAQSMIGRSARA